MDKIKIAQTREELYLSIPKGGVGAELGVCKGSNAAILFQYTKLIYGLSHVLMVRNGIHSLYQATGIIMKWLQTSSQKKLVQEELNL